MFWPLRQRKSHGKQKGQEIFDNRFLFTPELWSVKWSTTTVLKAKILEFQMIMFIKIQNNNNNNNNNNIKARRIVSVQDLPHTIFRYETIITQQSTSVKSRARNILWGYFFQLWRVSIWQLPTCLRLEFLKYREIGFN